MKGKYLEEASYNLSLAITKLTLAQVKSGELILSKQLMRCASSISANVQEALGAYSKRDFSAKLSIAYKEARETKYWLRLMKDCELLAQQDFDYLFENTDKICAVLFRLIQNSRQY